MDIIDSFQADLDALRSLIFELRIAEENSTQEAQAFTALVSLVKLQSEAQEKLLSPLRSKSIRLQTVIQHNSETLTGIRDVEAMIECCTNIVTWRSSVNIFCELLERLTAKQTRELFPAIFDEVNAKDREALGRTYQNLRGFVRHESPRVDWRRIWTSIFNQAG